MAATKDRPPHVGRHYVDLGALYRTTIVASMRAPIAFRIHG
jgi:hypothetical protein